MSELLKSQSALTLLQSAVDKALQSGRSYRDLARKCHFTSPNYLQHILNKTRGLTLPSAKKIARGLKLTKTETAYFLELAKLDLDRYKDKERILQNIRQIKEKAESISVTDAAIHQHWLFGVVHELADLEGFRADPDAIQKQLKFVVSKEEIASALKFLAGKKWINPPDDPTGKTPQKNFQPLNDVRRIELQRSHLRFLEMAKHRINDDLAEREFQGLTIAIRPDQFPTLKKKIREFFDQLQEDLTGRSGNAEVIRIQCCAYKLTK